ncbi:MAG: DinB family protein, partial [Phycisphaerales bacterium]|nr:DinB family protein [Phycisphaerales bacterium]
PTGDAGRYPSFSAMKDHLASRRIALIAWFRSLDDARLASKLGGDMDWFARSIGHLPGSIACHENMHAGQLTVVRKALNLNRFVA